MKHQTKIITIILLLFIISTVSITNAQTQGWGVGPNIIRLPNALKGAVYQQTVKIYNENDFDSNVLLNSTGEIKNWTTFYEFSNTTHPITSTIVNKTSTKDIILQITIPQEAANGEYNGTVIVTPKPLQTNKTQGNVTVVKLNLPIILSVNVTGEQNLNVSVERIQVKDTEIYYHARILVDFKNTGNVVASPIIEIEFSKNGQTVGSLSLSSTDYSYSSIQPGGIKTYIMWWNTSKAGLLLAGTYEAHFDITLAGKIVKQQNVSFEIFPQGTLVRNGTLEKITYEGELEKGKLLNISATFLNTGEVDVIVQFNGEVYRDGELIDTIHSQKTTVLKYNRASLESEVTIEENGRYVINGYVHYADELKTKEGNTDTLELKFTVGGVQSSFDLSQILIILAFLFVIVVGLVYILRKKQVIAINKPRSVPTTFFSNRMKKLKTSKNKKVNKPWKKAITTKKTRAKTSTTVKPSKSKRKKHIRIKRKS